MRRGSNQGNTQNEKSLYSQSSIDFRCYPKLARFEPRFPSPCTAGSARWGRDAVEDRLRHARVALDHRQVFCREGAQLRINARLRLLAEECELQRMFLHLLRHVLLVEGGAGQC